MARKSRKQQNITIEDKTKIYNVGIYARLSMEDKGLSKNYLSLQNQIELDKDYVMSCDDMVLFKVYSDNGYSGTNYNRPAFKEMMRDIYEDKINCIVVKDYSRLGRNFVETEQLINIFFQSSGIRFISINDNYDNLKRINEASVVVPFKNLINMMYSKDMSLKIGQSVQLLRKKGINVYRKAPYGYYLDNDYKLVINPETAPVVKQIFDLYLEYKSIRKVAEYLSNHNIITPYNYLKCESEPKIWNRGTIQDILTNPTYIGNYTQGRNESTYYKTGDIRIKNADSTKWVIHENTHEKIVDKEIFDEAQKLLNSSSKPKKKRKSVNNVFLGKIYCGVCGARIQKCGSNPDTSSYVCYTRMLNKEACNTKYISSKSFNNMILKLIKEEIKLELKKEVVSPADAKKKIKNMEKEMRDLYKSISEIKRKKFELYDNYIHQLVDEEVFKIGKAKYDEEATQYNNRVEELKNKTIKLNMIGDKLIAMKKHTRDRVLRKELVDLMISKIIVFCKDDVTIEWK